MEKQTIKEKIWNIIFSIVFLILFAILAIQVQKTNTSYNFGVFEFIILSLATFRIIRLFVYDRVMGFLRDFFNMKEPTGAFFTISKLLGCPWCFGIWGTLIICYIYFLIPQGNLLILILAIAGVASVIQITANLIGWNAEYKKIETNKLNK